MNELLKNLGVIVLLIGVIILAVPAINGGLSNTILLTGLGVIILGYIGHIVINNILVYSHTNKKDHSYEWSFLFSAREIKLLLSLHRWEEQSLQNSQSCHCPVLQTSPDYPAKRTKAVSHCPESE